MWWLARRCVQTTRKLNEMRTDLNKHPETLTHLHCHTQIHEQCVLLCDNEGHKEGPQCVNIIMISRFYSWSALLQPRVSLIMTFLLSNCPWELTKPLICQGSSSTLPHADFFHVSPHLMKFLLFSFAVETEFPPKIIFRSYFPHLSASPLSSFGLPAPPPPSRHYNVVGRLIEEVCRFVRQSNQSASHKTTG